MRNTLPSSLQQARLWIERIIEAPWLAAVLFVPLVFAPPGWFAFFESPKVALLRVVAGIIAALWTIDVALAVWGYGRSAVDGWRRRARVWLREEPVRWTVVAGATFLALVTLSTIASSVPRIGLWGLEWGRDGQSLYSVASAMVVFFAVALRLRTPRSYGDSLSPLPLLGSWWRSTPSPRTWILTQHT